MKTLTNYLISESFRLLKFTSYCGADIIARLLGIMGTESAYEIWKDILTSSLNELYDPQIKAARIALKNAKIKTWEEAMYKEKLAQDFYRVYMLPTLRKEWEKQDLIRQRNEKVKAWFNNNFISYTVKKYSRSILVVIIFVTLFMSDLKYMWIKKCMLENLLAEANNKLPKLQYLGSKGKIIKNIIGHNIGEIQIGVANRQLIDLYFPLKRRLYISAPNIEYSRKDLQLIKPVIKSLNTLHYRKYGKY